MRAAVFFLLLLLLLPLLLVGAVANIVALRRTRGIVSGTTYRPLQSRLALHHLGLRPDPAAVALANHLPATRGLGGSLFIDLVVWAWKVTGYRPPPVQFPPPLPLPISGLVPWRTAVFDEALAAALETVDQVVILGAGWDTRAYGACAGHDVTVFEVDAPPTQAIKRQGVENAALDTSNVVFVPCDFTHTSWLDALQEHGFDPQKPAFFLWEGVTMYLPEEVVHTTLRTIASLAGGTIVAFDGFGREWLETPMGKTAARRVARFYHEPWIYGVSTQASHAGLERFLAEQGLAPTRTWLSDDADPEAFYVIMVAQKSL